MLKTHSILTALFFDTEEEYQEALTAELENRDYYTADNVFWVPVSARWQALQEVSILNTGQNCLGEGNFLAWQNSLMMPSMQLKKTTKNSKASSNASAAMR